MDLYYLYEYIFGEHVEFTGHNGIHDLTDHAFVS